jgi:hypothetical protein
MNEEEGTRGAALRSESLPIAMANSRERERKNCSILLLDLSIHRTVHHYLIYFMLAATVCVNQ